MRKLISLAVAAAFAATTSLAFAQATPATPATPAKPAGFWGRDFTDGE